MNIKTTFKDFLNEMAMPTNEHKGSFWYHGTSEKSINKIIQDGMLKPSETVTKRSRGMLTPVYDKVYLTANIEEAIGYAYFRSEKNKPVYLVIVDGKTLKDIQPDEDIIADLLHNTENFKWLHTLAKNIDIKLYNKFQNMGDYAYAVSLGKKVVKQLTDEQKIEFINKGMKIAHSGGIEISQVWELPPSDKNHYEVTINGDNYKDLGKRIY